MVTRETSIADGLRALGLEARRAPRLTIFAALLESRAIPAGLLGSAEAEVLVPRHILQSCALVPFIRDAASVADVGAGAGLPGVPICAATDTPATFVESSARAAGFLRDAVAALDLRASVVQSSAEEAGRSEARERFEAVVSRAVGPPDVVLELTLPLVAVGGRAALLVGRGFRDTDQAATKAARALGGRRPEYFPIEVPGAEAATWVMIVDKVDPTAARYPRRPGVPRRRPLGGGVTGVK